MSQPTTLESAETGAVVRRTILDAVVLAYLAFTGLVFTGWAEAEMVQRLPTLAVAFLGVAIVGACVSVMLNRVGIKTLGWQIYAPPHLRMKSAEELATPMYQTFWGIQMILAVVVTTLVGIKMTEIDLIKLLEADRFLSLIHI